MDFDRYFGSSTSSRNYHSAIKSQFDICIDFEEIEEEEDDEEMKGEYACPFCSEDFDLLGLCCHIDEEHQSEAESGVCPVCLVRVGINIVGHITTHHGSIPKKSWHKLKLNKGESNTTILSLRKELQNGHFQSLLARSSSLISSSKMTDPLLSFVYNMPTVDVSDSIQPDSSTGENTEEKISYEKMLEINVPKSSLSVKDHVEKTKRCEFVQGLLLSTILDDGL